MFWHQPNITHLRVFGYVIYVPVVLPQRTKMRPEGKLEIYVEFDSPSIIQHLEPLTGDIFTVWFVDYDFDKTVFPPVRGEYNIIPKE